MFEHTTKLLRRFVSEEELPDLTIDNIRAVFAKLDGGIPLAPTAQTELLCLENQESHAGAIQSRHPPQPASNAAPLQGVGSVEEEPSGPQETVELDEHPLLQEELGCMALDSLHKYRECSHDTIFPKRSFFRICWSRFQYQMESCRPDGFGAAEAC